MTREELEAWAIAMLVTSFISTVVHPLLLWRATWRWRHSISRGDTKPARVTAEGEFWRAVIMLWIAAAGVGTGVLVATAILMGSFALQGWAGYVLAAFFLTFTTAPMVSGFRALYYDKKLDDAIAEVYLPCGDTTYESCPHITPERQLLLRAAAQAGGSDANAG